MMKDNTCIFCKIVAKEIPAYIIHETDDVVAFLDIMPLTRGHMLVIPKAHYATAWDTPPDVMGAVSAAATELARRSRDKLGCVGINMLVNCGEYAGQVVPHVHMHVLPRYTDDGIAWPWPAGKLTSETAQELVAQLSSRHDA